MVYASHRRVVVWKLLVMAYGLTLSWASRYTGYMRTLPEIVRFEDPRNPRDSQPIRLDNPSMSKEIDVRRQPPSMIQLPHIIRRFMVPPNHDSRNWRGLLPSIVPKP